mmetsp:Transcript_22125/g.30793  ORF Transcript_22125/g.30793 Transcript_22125/m.30793 type:complete len:473 (+) Transcript_22125:63-1481(+)
MTIQESAKSTLANMVEAHLTSLVREAACVQRHSKRARYHPTSSSASSNTAAASGTDGGDQTGVLRRRLAAEDINLALQWRGSEKLYATSIVAPEVDSNKDNRKIDLQAYLNNENQARAPSELALTSHWLAVDGTQPAIVQNPASLLRKKGLFHRVEEEDDDNVAIAGGSASAAGGIQSQEQNASSTASKTTSGVSVRQLLPRVLSEELQLYFTRITLTLERGGATPTTRRQQDAALASLARDAGLNELVPFLVRYVTKKLYSHLNQPEHCRTLIRMTRSLLSNPHVHLELHLQELMPVLVTCTVAEKLYSKPSENHWALRYDAAETLVQACNMFGDEYVTLKPRVLTVFCEAIEPRKAPATQFGGIVAITNFGPKAIDAFLLLFTESKKHLAVSYWEAWESDLETATLTNMDRRQEIQQCQQALLNAVAIYLECVNPKEQAERIDRDGLVDAFGEKLVPLENGMEDYTMCIL